MRDTPNRFFLLRDPHVRPRHLPHRPLDLPLNGTVTRLNLPAVEVAAVEFDPETHREGARLRRHAGTTPPRWRSPRPPPIPGLPSGGGGRPAGRTPAGSPGR